jgi:hypothetical protein
MCVTWQVPMTLGWSARRSAPRLISEVVHLVVAPPDALLLYIHHVQGHSHNVSNGRRPSAQELWPVSSDLRGRLALGGR